MIRTIAEHAVTGTDWTIRIERLTVLGSYRITVHNNALNDGQRVIYRGATEAQVRTTANEVWADVRDNPEAWVRLISR